MPYAHIRKKIPPELDRRIKIQKSEHDDIRKRHKEGEAIRAIARAYGVDKRLIQFIIYPERQAINLVNRHKRGGSKQYYNKDKWKETQKEHRHYKQSIKNKLI